MPLLLIGAVGTGEVAGASTFPLLFDPTFLVQRVSFLNHLCHLVLLLLRAVLVHVLRVPGVRCQLHHVLVKLLLCLRERCGVAG